MKKNWKSTIAAMMAGLMLLGAVTQGVIAFAGDGQWLHSFLDQLMTVTNGGEGSVIDDRRDSGLLEFLEQLLQKNPASGSNASDSDASDSDADPEALLASLSNAALLASPLALQAALPSAEIKNSADGLFSYRVENGEAVITGFSEGKSAIHLPVPNELVIPDTLETAEGDSLLVTGVDAFAFYQEELHSVKLGQQVRSVGEASFAGAGIGSLQLDSLLEFIGESAFRDNELTELELHAERIGKEAFSNNKLTTIQFGPEIRAIGDGAFTYNNLDVVTIPEGVTAYGTGVFASNNRYVLIKTGSPLIHTEAIGDQYGQVVNPVKVLVRAIDRDTGRPILADQSYGENRENLNGIVFLNVKNRYQPVAIPGYEPVEKEILYTPDRDGYLVQVPYRNIGLLPQIIVKQEPYIPVDGDGSVGTLLSFVEAKDLEGTDISASVTVEPNSVPTNVSGAIIPVIYQVKDKYGNVGTKEVKISIGVKWSEFPLGKGWVLGDFTYDGNKVIGFSESGLTKVQTQKELVLPHLNPQDGSTGIDTVADNPDDRTSFRGKDLTSVTDFLSTEGEQKGNITEIEGIARQMTTDSKGGFSRNAITAVTLNALEDMGGKAFQWNRLNRVSFPSLKTIHGYALSKNDILKIEENDLPKLETIEVLGLNENENLTYVNLPSLREAGYVSFWECKIDTLIAPSLETVGNGAFLENRLTEITEAKYPSLRILENRAFKGNPLTHVSIPMVTELRGDAFWSSNLPANFHFEERFDNLEVLGPNAFSDWGHFREVTMPKLKRIGSYAFWNNPGVPEWGNKVVIRTDPANNSIPSKENYVVNPVHANNGPWEDVDFTWSLEDPDMVTGFSAAGREKLTVRQYALELPDHTKIVGASAFEGIGLVSVRAPGVIEVKDSAFYGNQLTDINESFPRLQHISEDWAFGKNKLTELKLPSVLTVGDYAFSANAIKRIELDAATEIGVRAFAGAPVEELKADRLERIGKRAFYSHQLNTLDLPNVREIGVAAFSEPNKRSANAEAYDYPESSLFGDYKPGSLESLNLPKAEVIHDLAFAGNRIQTVNLPSLKRAGRRAFDQNQIKGDLEMPNLEQAGLLAFGSNQIDNAYFGQALKELDGAAFRNNRNRNKSGREVFVFLMDGSAVGENPNRIPDGFYGGTRQHIVNPTHVIIRYVDTEGNPLRDPVSGNVLAPLSEYIFADKSYEHVHVFGYKADRTQITVPDDRTPHEERFVYTKVSYVNTRGAELRQGNETDLNTGMPKRTYYIGETMTTWVYLDVTDDNNTFRQGEIRVFFDPNYIDASSIQVKSGGTTVQSSRIYPGEVRIQLATNGSVTGGYSLGVPIEWRFKKYETPNHHELSLNALFMEGETQISVAEPICLEGYYHQPSIVKSSPLNLPDYPYRGMTAASDGPRLIGGLTEYMQADETRGYKVSEALPVRYDFGVSDLERYVSAAVLTDTLPRYIAVNERGEEEERDAAFDAAANPSWSLSTDASGTKILTQNLSFPRTLAPGKYFEPLTLSYPDLKSGYNIKNNIRVELVPDRKEEQEETLTGTDDLTIYAGYYAPIFDKGDPRFEKLTMGLPYGDYFTSYFYDTPSDRRSVIPYLLRVSSMSQESDLMDVRLFDYGLDPRLYYYGVSFPRDSHTAGNTQVDIVAYKKLGAKLDPDHDRILQSEHIRMSEANKVIFSEPIAGDIDYILIALPKEHKVFSALEFQIDTKLRHPEQPQYDATGLSHRNVYRNDAVMAANLYVKGTDVPAGTRGDLKAKDGRMISKYQELWDLLPGNYLWGEHAEVYVRTYEQALGVSKTQTYPGSGDRTVYPGESGDYVLSLRIPDSNGTVASLWIEDLTDFEMIDLLPKGIDVNEIVLSPGFKNSGGTYEVVGEWGNSGRMAIRFQANRLTAGVCYIATIKTSASPALEPGFVTNELFVDFASPKVKKVGQRKALQTENGTKEYLYDSASFRFNKPNEMYAVKSIRKAGDLNWSTEGVQTESEGKLEYRLSLYNNLNLSRDGIQVVDFFPYLDDVNIQETNINSHDRPRRGRGPSGARVSSEFCNTFDLSGEVEVLEGQTKASSHYKIYYWNSDTDIRYNQQSAEHVIENLTWSDTPAANTKGIKVVARKGVKLDKNGVLHIIVPMKAPKNDTENDFVLSGKRAHNSFVRKDSATLRFIEPNTVWNELAPPKGSIRFQKYGQDELDPEKNSQTVHQAQLAGATFTATDRAGNVYTAVSDGGGMVTFSDLPILETYEIRETGMPEGYETPFDPTGAVQHVATVTYDDFKAAYGKAKQENPSDPSKWRFEVRLSDALSKEQFLNVKPIYGNLLLEKTNGNGTALPYVRFRLEGLNAWNEKVQKEFLTDAEGKAKVEHLIEGSYRLTEIPKANQTGYLPVEPKEFTIDRNHTEIRYTGENRIVNQELQLVIHKLAVDADFDLSQGLQKLTDFGMTRLDGYRFTVRDLTPGSNWSVTSEQTVGGAVILKGLKINTLYEITEVKKDSNNYRHNPLGYRFRLNEKAELTDENGQVFRQNLINFPNPRKKIVGRVEVEKKDGEGNPLAGARFGVFRNGELVQEQEAVLQADGRARAIFEQLPSGVYTLRETAAPKGFAPSTEEKRFTVPFTVSEYEPDMENGETEVRKKFAFSYVNYPIRLEVIKGDTVLKHVLWSDFPSYQKKNPNYRYRKTSETRGDLYLPLSGALFTLYRKEENGGRTTIGTFTSDSEGRIDLSQVQFDAACNYVLMETQAPAGYRLDSYTNPGIDLNLRDEIAMGSMQQGVLKRYKENHPIRGRILISKRDADERTALQGVTFALYRVEAFGMPADQLLEALKTEQSNASGMVEFGNLALGKYVVRELAAPEGYQKSDRSYEFDLTDTDSTGSIIVNNPHYVAFDVEKKWRGEAKAEVVIHVLRNGEPARDQSGTLVPPLHLNAENHWTGHVSNLLRTDTEGNPYTYTLKEDGIEGYRAQITGGADYHTGKFTVTNAPESEVLIGVTKRWEGKPGAKAVIRLYADDVDTGMSVTLSKENNWQYVFTGLEKQKDGREIRYTVREDPQPGYETDYSGDAESGFVITNRELPPGEPPTPHTPSNPSGRGNPPSTKVRKTRRVTVQKQWQGKALESVEIYLYRDGVKVDTARLSADNNWRFEFTDLPKQDASGHRYSYTVDEAYYEQYVPSLSGNQNSGYTITNRELPPGEPPATPHRPGRLPRTGDSYRLWFGMMLAGFGLLTGFLSLRRKKKLKKETKKR